MYSPDPLIEIVSPGEVHTVIVTVGTAMRTQSKLTTQVDILYEGNSVILEDLDAYGYSQNPIVHNTSDGNTIYISSLFVRNTQFKQPGCYEIQVRLLRNDNEGKVTSELVDSMCSRFFVSMNGEA